MTTQTKIVLGVVAVLLVGLVVYQMGAKDSQVPEEPNQVVCTLDAKMCPDGSYVGRMGPNCEFAPCPGTGGSTY